MLIKFLDTKIDLSVQVHPCSHMAKEHYDSFGKTKMWYVVDSDNDANIVIELNKDLTNPVILNHIISENVETVFNR